MNQIEHLALRLLLRFTQIWASEIYQYSHVKTIRTSLMTSSCKSQMGTCGGKGANSGKAVGILGSDDVTFKKTKTAK